MCNVSSRSRGGEDFYRIIVVHLDAKRIGLAQVQFVTGLIPELSTTLPVCHLGDNGRGDAVEDNNTIGGEDSENLRHNFLQMASMTADEHGIRTRE